MTKTVTRERHFTLKEGDKFCIVFNGVVCEYNVKKDEKGTAEVMFILKVPDDF